MWPTAAALSKDAKGNSIYFKEIDLDPNFRYFYCAGSLDQALPSIVAWESKPIPESRAVR